ncbi:MAG: tripartite tricarboxylate transporter substrate binding protein [Betaproteobacteria bacterium]|nr:tripartite tricarboxylate transporter substrate binding protein [Betaproteobacteria bacterium]
MKSMARNIAVALVGLVVTLAIPVAHAQAYPAKTITLVVPFPPGGTTDVLARSIAQKLGESWGQSVIVDNRPGAGATIGAAQVAKAPADGYTLLMGAVHHTIATSIYAKLPYDFQKDLAPVTIVAMVPNILCVNPGVPAKSVKELVAYGKANPGKLSYGSNGQGTAQHLIGEQFSALTGVDMLHIPYKGSGPLTSDLIAGQVSMSFDTITPVLPQIKAGKLRPLAVTTAARSPALPDVPTLAESGLAGFDQGTWFGVLAPAATPKEIVGKLNAEIVRILKLPDIQKRFAEIGAQPIGNSPTEMAATIKSDTEKYAVLAKKANVKID